MATKEAGIIPDDHLTPAQYAEKRRISLRTVHRWLKLKIIKAEQPAGMKGRWFIPR